jgi:GntR family transcriptional repressor for pyruvate dehydrogenase complex
MFQRPLTVSLLLRTGSAAFEQLMEARFIVETDMTALAAERRTDEDLAEMHSALDAARRGSGDYEAFLQEDLRFHAAVARASHNLLLALFTDPVNACLRESYREPLAYLARQSTTLKEHQVSLSEHLVQESGEVGRGPSDLLVQRQGLVEPPAGPGLLLAA